MNPRRLGELLVERGLATPSEVRQALALQKEVGGLIGALLVRLGAVSEDKLLETVSDQLGIPLLGRDDLPGSAELAAGLAANGLTPAWWLDREAALFAAPHGGAGFVCAAKFPLDPRLIEVIGPLSPVELRLANHGQWLALARLLGGQDESEAATSAALMDGEGAGRLRELAEEAPVIDFVNAMFAEALKRKASDVHIEPFESQFVVRLRADGVLREWRAGPRSDFDAVASRIKLLSGMDIGERRLPQDGRQSIRMAGEEVDLRVSTLPAAWGESIVMRLLGKTRALPTLGELGASEDQRITFTKLTAFTNGVVLITGPTGSGKTTTIYRLIRDIDDGERKIITIEDPVEFDLPGVVQVPVKSDIGLTFAASLRSVLRQDPDVIMIGEIRDAETARIAVQAALTGHLVISTVHTNSALAGASRMLDLGVDDFLLSDVLRGLVAQRLLRKLCGVCSAPEDAATVAALEARLARQSPGLAVHGKANWRHPVGCPSCGGSGYRGRLGVYELAEISQDLSGAIRRRASEDELVTTAARNGYKPMLTDGLLKARDGLTSAAEVIRVLGDVSADELADG